MEASLYPSGEQRTELFRAKSALLRPAESELSSLLQEQALAPAIAILTATNQGGLHSHQLSAVLCSIIDNLNQHDLTPKQVEVYQKLFDLTTLFQLHMYDYDMMITEALISGERIACNPGFIKLVLQGALRELKREQGGSIEVNKVVTYNDTTLELHGQLLELATRVHSMCCREIMDRPLEQFPALAPAEPTLSETVRQLIAVISAKDVFSVHLPGGLAYREALARLGHRLGLESALDVGTGYGLMLPVLADKFRRVISIDTRFEELSTRIIPALGKVGCSIRLTDLSEYSCQEDVVFVSGAEFFDPETAPAQIARIARSRAVIGVRSMGSPFDQYSMLEANLRVGSHFQVAHAYEPLRWLRELSKHFARTTMYCYNQRRFIIEAEK